jgi:phytoene desaturase
MSAGIYARIRGYEAVIYEKHATCGGECTGWDRKGFHFDGCIHWLIGSKPGTDMNKLWHEVGALDDSVQTLTHDVFAVLHIQAKKVNIYCDADRSNKHFKEIAPEDTVAIDRMTAHIKGFSKIQIDTSKPYDMYSLKDNIQMIKKMLPVMPLLKKCESISAKDYIDQFKNEALKTALSSIVPLEHKATSLISTLNTLHEKDGGWPAGGSRAFAKRMEKKFFALGGQIKYKSSVEDIIIDRNKAIGIKLQDHTEQFADYIISTADGYHTLFELLNGKYLDKDQLTLYTDKKRYPVFSSVLVSMGIDCDLSKYPHSNIFMLEQPLDSGGITHTYIGLKHYCFEPSFAPKGQSVLHAFLYSDYDWWKKVSTDKKSYKEQKDRISSEVIALVEKVYPETKNNIKAVDVATPLTYARYCNAYKGAWMSHVPTPGSKIRFLSGKIKGLDHFFMAGQWIMPPGGLPTAVVTGKWVIQRIAAADKTA